MKKLFTFALLFLSIGMLAACGDSEDQQAANTARDSLQIYSTTLSEIRGDFTVPLVIRGAEVTWTVDRDDLIEFGNVIEPQDEGDILEQDVLVTRPTPDEGHQDVTLTATVTVNDASATREFEGVVRAAQESDVYTDFSELYDNASMNDLITAQGVITGVFEQGYFLYDGEHHLGIYIPGGHDKELGDEVAVTGSYSRYNTLYQLGNIESQELVSSGNDYDIEPVEISLSDFHELDLDDPLIHGMHYTVTGLLDTRGEYENVAIVDLDDADLYFMVYHQSLADSISDLRDNLGKVVEITVIYYTTHSRDGVLVAFQETAADLVEVELGDEELFNQDIQTVKNESYMTFEDNIVLPSEGNNETQFTNWSSDNTDLIADDGTFVDRPAATTEVTLTADASLGTLSEEVSITVTVVGTDAYSVSEAYAYEDGENVHVEGIVTALDPFGNGLFMQDEDGPGIYVRLFSRDEDAFANVQPGDKISVFGTLDRYTSHGNNERQLSEDKLLTSVESGHSVNIITDMTSEDIILGFNGYDSDGDANQAGGGTNLVKYRLENVSLYDEDWGDVKIGQEGYVIELGSNDDLARRLLIDLEESAEFGFPSAEDFEDGLTITYIEFVIQRIHFGNFRIVITDVEFAE